jgi:Rhs element Vgr protein
MPETRRIPTSRGTDRPTFRIFTDGNEIDPSLQILGIRVSKSVNRIASAQLMILDGDPATGDFPASGNDAFVPGKEIEIKAGYHSDDNPIFKGIIVKLGVKAFENKPSLFRVECRDQAVKLSLKRKNRYFYEITDSELIEELAREKSLEVEAESTSHTHAELLQFHATDWDFLVSRAEANGLLVTTEDGKLVASPPDLSQDPNLSLEYGGNVLDFEFETDARQQYAAVESFSWDAANQEALQLEGNPPSGTLPGNLSPEDLAEAMDLDSYELRHGGQLKDTELQAWADAQLLKSQLAKVRGRVRIQGYGDIKPGQVVEMLGVGPRFEGKVLVSGVRHEINVQNWETQLELGLSTRWFAQEHPDMVAQQAHGLLPAINGLQIGLVTALESDPEGEDRVQVRLPIIDAAEEGAWARIASLDAGDNRGAFFRPEIGDEVVVGFLNDDPRHPVILGMLNSSAKPAPVTAADDNHVKGFVTRSEMKMLFDDEKKAFTLETPGGKLISVDEDAGEIKLEDENGNKVVMDSSGITIESASDLTLKAAGDVTVEGTNVEASANANFTASGSAGSELSSSATTVIQGAMVQIN